MQFIKFSQLLAALGVMAVGIAGASSPGHVRWHVFGPYGSTPNPPAYIPPFTNYQLAGAAGVDAEEYPQWIVVSITLASSINGAPYQNKGSETSPDGISVAKVWTVVNQQSNVSVVWREQAFFYYNVPPGSAHFNFLYCGPYNS